MVNLAFSDLFTVAKGQFNHRLQLDCVDIAMIASSSRSLQKKCIRSRVETIKVRDLVMELRMNRK
jgi:hypothetical protein